MSERVDNRARLSLVNPGFLQERAREDRARITASLEALNARRSKAIDIRKRKLDEIEKLQRDVALLDHALVVVDQRREEALAMDDALSGAMREFERILARRTGS